MFDQLKKDVEELKRQVYEKEEKGSAGFFERLTYMTMFFEKKTLREEVDSLHKRIDKLQSKLDLLVAHFNLEQFKITDENGKTQITEGFRKIKKTNCED